MKAIGILLMISLVMTPAFSLTGEASSLANPESTTARFHQQFDIVFWQTLPFAALWGHFIDRQLSSFMYPGSAAHWEVIVPFAIAVSAANAFLHARRVTEHQEKVDSGTLSQ